MKYLLGVDAGGTSTSYCLYDFLGNKLEEYEGESIHFMQYDQETIHQRLLQARKYFEEKYNFEDIFVAMGLGGYGQDPKVRAYIESMIYAVFPDAVLKSDAEFAMISALEGGDGIYLISGTGSIAFRKQGDELSRQGGFGYLLADEGSGFWIGRKILERFTQEADGRQSKTDLYDTMMEHFSLKQAHDLIAIATEKKDEYRHWVASLSGLFANVKGAQDIYEAAGKELAKLVNGFEAKEKTYLAVGGSVLLKNKTVKDSLIENLDPVYVLIENQNDVEWAVSYIYKSNRV